MPPYAPYAFEPNPWLDGSCTDDAGGAVGVPDGRPDGLLIDGDAAYVVSAEGEQGKQSEQCTVVTAERMRNTTSKKSEQKTGLFDPK